MSDEIPIGKAPAIPVKLLAPMRTWPIRRKLIANSVLTSSLALLLAGILLIVFEMRQTRLNVASELTSVGEMLGNTSTAPLIFNDRQAAQRTLNALRAIQRIAVAGIARPDGSWFAAYTRADLPKATLPRHIGPDGHRFEGKDMVLFRTLAVDGEIIGTVYLRSDMTEVVSKLRQYGLLLALVTLAASLASFVAAALLHRSIYGPVAHLAAVAHGVSDNNNYHSRAIKTSDDELGVLVDAFNGMLDQVEHRDRELEEKVADRTTELTLTNQELTTARDHAEESTRLKSEFLANMSHEIRSPMNVIIGMTQIALETQLTAKQNRYLSLVRNSAESLLTIINDILDFSKIEAGKLDVEAVEFRLPQFLTETMMPLVVRAGEKGLDLHFQMEPDLPGRVMGDPIRLGQVIINLISNAIKFTPTGKIDMFSKLVKEDDDRSIVCFTVADTGIGIDLVNQNLIFEPFRQNDGSTTRRYGGTGLGLSISKHLVEMMGGVMWLESALGEGSRFHFTIEFAKPAQAPAPAPGPSVAAEKVHAIIVEPDETRRAHVAGLLQAWNIEAAVVNSGSTALDVMRWTARLGRPFAFAVIGLAAALENERFLVTALQRDPKLAQLPLVVIGDIVMGDENAESVQNRDFDAAAWLTWPLSQSALLEAVFRFLGSSAIGFSAGSTPSAGPFEADGNGFRILVAEDSPANQEVLLALFEKRGDSLTIVNNGREAVAAIQSAAPFDLILMDVQMPEMGGVEATAAIRGWEARMGKRTPIVALTAHAMKGDREAYLASGMDGYVSKPIRAQELFREVDKWAATQIRLDPSRRQPLCETDSAALWQS